MPIASYASAAETDLSKAPRLAQMMPRVVERILGRRKTEPEMVLALFRLLSEGKSPDYKAAGQCLGVLAAKVQNGEINGEQSGALRQVFGSATCVNCSRKTQPVRCDMDAALLAVSLKEPMGREVVRRCCQEKGQPESVRLRALEALIVATDDSVLDAAAVILADRKGQSLAFRGQVLAALGKLDDKHVSAIVLDAYERMEPDLQPKAIELLTQRPAWGMPLIQAIGAKKVPTGALNVNQVRKLLASKDAELVKQVKTLWGTIREGANPEREKIVKDMGAFLRQNRGDARAGAVVFKNLCGQCHKIHGEGFDVGPDLTGNGRASFDQLLSNVFDPSLVIGAAYQATTVQTTKGRTLTGLVVEDNARRIVLKLQGGKLEAIPRSRSTR